MILFQIVPDRSAETLTSVIMHHLKPGSQITTDCWRGYSSLERLGYVHHTVNHGQNFVDPITGKFTVPPSLPSFHGATSVDKGQHHCVFYKGNRCVIMALALYLLSRFHGATLCR